MPDDAPKPESEDAAARPRHAERVLDPARLAAVRASGLLDSAVEAPLDQLARLAARLLDAPTALISLVDADRQYFKSAIGLREPWGSARQTPLSHSFCRHAVDAGESFVVPDARQHPLVRDNPAIEDLGVQAYAGVPLTTEEGHTLGTLCVIDSHPREWTETQLRTLDELAKAVMASLARHGDAEAGLPDTSSEAADPPPATSAERELQTRRLAERLGEAAEALRRGASEFLEELGRFDQLLLTDKPTPENLAREARALARVGVARARLIVVLAAFAAVADEGGGSVAADPTAAEIVARAEPLRRAANEYFRLHGRRGALEEELRTGEASLTEFEQVATELAHAEYVLREALLTFEYTR